MTTFVDGQSAEAVDVNEKPVPKHVLGTDEAADRALCMTVVSAMPLLIALDPFRRRVALDMLLTLDEGPRVPGWQERFASSLREVLPLLVAALHRSGTPPIVVERPIRAVPVEMLVRAYGHASVADMLKDLGFNKPEGFDDLPGPDEDEDAKPDEPAKPKES